MNRIALAIAGAALGALAALPTVGWAQNNLPSSKATFVADELIALTKSRPPERRPPPGEILQVTIRPQPRPHRHPVAPVRRRQTAPSRVERTSNSTETRGRIRVRVRPSCLMARLFTRRPNNGVDATIP
jgi:hypothetical protein